MILPWFADARVSANPHRVTLRGVCRQAGRRAGRQVEQIVFVGKSVICSNLTSNKWFEQIHHNYLYNACIMALAILFYLLILFYLFNIEQICYLFDQITNVAEIYYFCYLIDPICSLFHQNWWNKQQKDICFLLFDWSNLTLPRICWTKIWNNEQIYGLFVFFVDQICSLFHFLF